MGMIMIMFRSAWYPTEFVEDDKFVSATLEYVEEHEIVCEPHQVEKSPHDVEKACLKDVQNEGVAVFTGVAAGAAIGEVMHDEDGSPFNENSVKAFPFDENGDESEPWLVVFISF